MWTKFGLSRVGCTWPKVIHSSRRKPERRVKGIKMILGEGLVGAAAALLVVLLSACPQQGRSQCAPDSLVLYHVSLKTHWTRDRFPRHYPGFGYRPSASWSRLIGRTHNSSYVLFRIGGMASPGLKKFAETSSSDTLDEFSQGSTGVFDAFNASPILSGEGQTQTQFFVDGNHSKVSMVARIIPSPDWFCGTDSVDLCLNNEWIDNLTIDMDPVDAGTDNGYTYSAPNWSTEPAEAIYLINSVKLHPAHSFYREDRTIKPKSFATLTIIKLKEYSLSALRDPGIETPVGSDSLYPSLYEDVESNDIGSELNEVGELKDHADINASKKKRSRKLRGGRSYRDCTLSEWSEWSECSALCGFGQQRRNRYITTHPRGGGTQCPALTEKRLCNSARECRENYFDW